MLEPEKYEPFTAGMWKLADNIDNKLYAAMRRAWDLCSNRKLRP